MLAIGAAVAILSSVIPYTLELEALRRLPAGVFGVLMSLEPAMAALAGFVVLDEDLAARELVAIAGGDCQRRRGDRCEGAATGRLKGACCPRNPEASTALPSGRRWPAGPAPAARRGAALSQASAGRFLLVAPPVRGS